MVMRPDRRHKKQMIGLSLRYLMSTQMMNVTYLHATKMQWSWRCWYWGDVDLRCELRWWKLWYAKSMSYCNDYVSSRAWMSTCIFCSMKIDTSRCTTLMIHFVEVFTSRSQPTFLFDLIVLYWIKTHCAELMGATYGLCKYTIQQQPQQQRSHTRFVELQMVLLEDQFGILIRGQILFKCGRMMWFNFDEVIRMKKINFLNLWTFVIKLMGTGHTSRCAKGLIGSQAVPK